MKYRVVNLVAFAFMILVNALANALPINGKTTGELSDQYPNLFVPAGITFSIWGIIYLSLLTVVLRLLFSIRLRKVMESLGWLIAINFLLNALWIIFWHYEFVSISMLIMITILATLVVINTKLMKHNVLLPKFVFGIYLGWICLATIANMTALLVAISWGGFGLSIEFWTITLIFIGAFVSILAMHRLKNPFLALALIWGFYGIVLKRSADYPSIAFASYIGIAISFVSALVLIITSKHHFKKSELDFGQ